ncbi:S1C family serine protease [Streptomyces sp. NPDC059506]|uniref:S1C family serine protease n=1 Tax=Streptomyces sp. NPDC059506 TaxID=3347751 RepID=UPI00368F8E92
MNEGKGTGPQWWSRPGPDAASPRTAAAPVPAPPPRPAPGGTADGAAGPAPEPSAPSAPPPASAAGDRATVRLAALAPPPAAAAPEEGAPAGGAPQDGAAFPAEPVHGTSAEDDTVPGVTVPPSGAPAPPAHPRDPYGTPPYGRPGPWAPAPPVQHPAGAGAPPAYPYAPHPAGPPSPQPATPPEGLRLPAYPQPQPQGTWSRYDPWGAPPPAPAPEGRGRRRGRLLVGALLIALVAGGLGGTVGASLRDGGAVTIPQAPVESGHRAPDSVAGIAAATLPGVVYIHVRGGGEEGTGTGFVLDGSGRIITNNHVVEPAADGGTISVTFNDGDVRKAEIVGRDSGYDLAVIEVDGKPGPKPLVLGNSDSVRVGDPVVAIGAPYDLEGTVTSGIISAKDRPITAGGETDGSDVSYVNALQTDAPINPGNSGGPLVDSRGRVIGINTAIRSADSGTDPFGGGQGGSIGLGFAIPVNQAKRVAEELIATGRATHPVIGVTVDMAYDGPGAKVSEKDGSGRTVSPGGPGDEAGIEPGDVITEVDGDRVRNGEELIVKIRSRRPGDRMELTVERDGKERTITLTLGSATDD